MPSKPALESVPKVPKLSVEEAVKEYVAQKKEIERLERQIAKLKPIIESRLEAEPEHKALIAGYLVSLTEISRELFDLKGAREKIDGRVLRPYLKTVTYQQLRVAYKGGEQR